MMQIQSEEFRAAILRARATALEVKMLSMEVANDMCREQGLPVAYNETAFLAAIDEYGCGHNQIVLLAIHGQFE